MIECVRLSNDEKILAIADRNNLIHLWDMKNNSKIDIFKGHSEWVKSIEFNSSKKVLASCSTDGTIKI